MKRATARLRGSARAAFVAARKPPNPADRIPTEIKMRLRERPSSSVGLAQVPSIAGPRDQLSVAKARPARADTVAIQDATMAMVERGMAALCM
jgi:hypothetical protein